MPPMPMSSVAASIERAANAAAIHSAKALEGVRVRARPCEVRPRWSIQSDVCGSRNGCEAFLLPADAREGDWIEIGQLGAYGGCLRTPFNGFDRAWLVDVRDPPLLSTTTAGRVLAVA